MLATMKTVLCYGDSLTWGYDAIGLGRHAYEDRWPSVLQAGLGEKVRVVAEGLNGRTTAYDDHTAAAERNGVRMLPTILATHQPLDLVILALGTNDVKRSTGGGRVFEAQSGMERLVEIVRSFPYSFAYAPPDILIVAPPRLVKTANEEFDLIFGHAIEEAKGFGAAYRKVAAESGCHLFEAASACVAAPVDGVHLDAENTRRLGQALVPVAAGILGVS